MLAQEFLEHDDPGRVVMHLSQCKRVWHSFRLPISKLIGLIESGEYVNLQGCEFVGALNQHSYRLQMQWMRARCLEEAAEPSPDAQLPKSPEEIAAATHTNVRAATMDRAMGSEQRSGLDSEDGNRREVCIRRWWMEVDSTPCCACNRDYKSCLDCGYCKGQVPRRNRSACLWQSV
jgi:hypothetical protein